MFGFSSWNNLSNPLPFCVFHLSQWSKGSNSNTGNYLVREVIRKRWKAHYIQVYSRKIHVQFSYQGKSLLMCNSVMYLLLKIFIFHVLSLKTIGALCSNVKNIKSCLHYAFPHSILHDISKCDRNHQWTVMSFRTMQFAPDQTLNRHFSAEWDRRNYIREVENAIFSVVYPTPLKIRPRLAAVAYNALLEVLDIDPEQAVSSETFLKFVNGDSYDPRVLPLSHRCVGILSHHLFLLQITVFKTYQK